jgi:hypothetical protein
LVFRETILRQKSLAALQQLMSLAEHVPRLDVLRAPLRVVDFEITRAVMLLDLVCETTALQRAVMDGVTIAFSKEQQVRIKQAILGSKYADPLDTFRALRIFDDRCDADALLRLAHQPPFLAYDPEDCDFLKTFDEVYQVEIQQAVSIAGDFLNWQAVLALSLCDFDINKAAMLLALIRSGSG